MRARTLMTGNPVVLTGKEPISRAAQLMRDLDIGIVPVVDDRAHMRPKGVITDRDIAVRCAAEKHPGDCLVEDHMTKDHLVTVPAEADASVVLSAMGHHKVRRVLVTEAGRLVGIVAQADVLLKQGPLDPFRVEEVLERVSARAVSAEMAAG